MNFEHLNDIYEDYLEHYGVKGMEWGKKKRLPLGSTTSQAKPSSKTAVSSVNRMISAAQAERRTAGSDGKPRTPKTTTPSGAERSQGSGGTPRTPKTTTPSGAERSQGSEGKPRVPGEEKQQPTENKKPTDLGAISNGSQKKNKSTVQGKALGKTSTKSLPKKAIDSGKAVLDKLFGSKKTTVKKTTTAKKSKVVQKRVK